MREDNEREMSKANVMEEHKASAKHGMPSHQARLSPLGWLRKKLRKIKNRKSKDLEIYPLF
jgi:hypothetical protein